MGVEDGYASVNFGANEARDGHSTNGKYNVLLPDGRTQTVTYTVDGYGGYVADVQYDGYAKEYKPALAYKPAPVYKPAPAPTSKPAPAPAYKPAPTPAYKP